MKIEYTYLNESIKLEEFADANGLTLVVTERTTYFLAKFKDCSIEKQILSGHYTSTLLREIYGTGNTEEDAINNLIYYMTHKTLIYHPPDKPQKEIRVPCIKPYYSKDL
jgi:hypothetical protein